jgi:hypothetical protein
VHGEADLITQKTVFVLGAGASAPFGFQIGGELFDDVVNNFWTNTSVMAHVTNTTNFKAQEVAEFVAQLKHSGMRSVDAFLERRPEYIQFGKAAMATLLILRENLDKLWVPVGNWMQYLFARMGSETLDDFGNNEVSFITFNYDRSLETFLTVSLSNTFGKSLEECGGLIKKRIPIIHLHGKLGYLPWEGKSSRMFGEHNITAEIMMTCIDEMKIVHEGIEDRDDDFKNAKELLAKAKRRYMLGFGFGFKNVERLGLENLDVPQRNIIATAYGLTGQEREEVTELCYKKVQTQDTQCLDLLRNFAPLS